MVRAILDGRKTQTRRVITERWQQCLSPEDEPEDFLPICPYGLPGDKLWVRETFAYIWPDVDPVPLHECTIEYRADSRVAYPGGWPAEDAKGNDDAPKWKPSIFMPRWASRISLEIVEVRVEQIQAISEDDAKAEGLRAVKGPLDTLMYEGLAAYGQFADPRVAYRMLWDDINFKRGYGWDTNPWVWAITFRKAATP